MDKKAAIKQIKKLLKEGALQEALDLTLKLREENPYLRDIHPWVEKCKRELRKKERKEEKIYIKKGLKKIKHLFKNGKNEEVIKACKELLDVDPLNKRAHKLKRKASLNYIRESLKNPIREKWEQAGEWEKLYIFYSKLSTIFPEHKKIRKLKKEAQEMIIKDDTKQKVVFSKESLTKLEKLFKQEEYERVIQGTQELIAFTHQGSKEAKKLLEKSIQANHKDTEQKLEQLIKEKSSQIKLEYQEKKEGIIKV